MPFIGLTGGFGTGKTTVLTVFRNAGAYTISADSLVHEILKKPSVMKKLSAALGKEVLMRKASGNAINKKRMAEIIFNDAKKRIAAEKIIHPEVIKAAGDVRTKILSRKPGAMIVFEVPLLFERGYRKMFDSVIVVHCSKGKALERLEKQGISKRHALKRMSAQMPISKKKAYADFLIHNNSALDALRPQVKTILRRLRN